MQFLFALCFCRGFRGFFFFFFLDFSCLYLFSDDEEKVKKEKDEYVLISSTFFNLSLLSFIFPFSFSVRGSSFWFILMVDTLSFFLLVPLAFFFIPFCCPVFFGDHIIFNFVPIYSLFLPTPCIPIHILRRLHVPLLHHYITFFHFPLYFHVSYSPLFVRRSSSLLYYYLPFFLPFIFPVSRDHAKLLFLLLPR